jgi:3-hydroxyisobutyrate dehydrogenase-like beta-hydroxyacid dehydrogenase
LRSCPDHRRAFGEPHPDAAKEFAVTRIAILHPGEMGSAIGGALIDVGHEVYWLPRGRGPASVRRASQAGLLDRSTVLGCDVVISICPPSAAVATASSVDGFSGLYVDANAISPRIAATVSRIVAASGADYVDGGVIGPPPTAAGTTRVYLSGQRAAEVAAVFRDARIEARVVDTGDFAASSLKMVYAAWTKISAALLLAVRGAAAELDVEHALVEEWAESQSGLEDRYQAAQASAAAKGWRWEDEMRQIARTFIDAGQPGGFGEAAADVFTHHERPEPTA